LEKNEEYKDDNKEYNKKQEKNQTQTVPSLIPSYNVSKVNCYQEHFKIIHDKNKLSKNFLQCVSRTASDVIYQTLNMLPYHEKHEFRMRTNLQKNIHVIENLISSDETTTDHKNVYIKHLKTMKKILNNMEELKEDYDQQKETMVNSSFLRAFLNGDLPSFVLNKEDELKRKANKEENNENFDDFSKKDSDDFSKKDLDEDCDLC